MSDTTKYLWKGKTAKGEILSGEYEATSKDELTAYLRKRRITITSIKEKKKAGGAGLSKPVQIVQLGATVNDLVTAACRAVHGALQNERGY